jgi:prepilin-type N-terminal cleavage/methylation domain-containing protein
MDRKNDNHLKGFTLIELLVVIATFVIILVTAVNLFVVMIFHQRRILAEQELLSQVSYATEYMGRSLRMAAKVTDTDCLSIVGKNYEVTHSGQGIKFINASNANICQEFFLDSVSGTIKEIKNGKTSVSLTAGTIKINEFNAAVYGDTEGDMAQPRVVIALDVEKQTKDFQIRKHMEITVSQRNLDE